VAGIAYFAALFCFFIFLFLVSAQYSFYIRPCKGGGIFRRFHFVTSYTLKIQKCHPALCKRNEYG
jgi:hypothetical protein